jgi:hypothetical protein
LDCAVVPIDEGLVLLRNVFGSLI